MTHGVAGPPGVTPGEGGSNVAVVSRNATRVDVSVFDGDVEAYRFPLPERLGDVHFGFIQGLLPGVRYGLRADGPWDPAQGHRFDASKLLTDPFATRLDRPFVHHPALTERGSPTMALVPKCIVETYSPPGEPAKGPINASPPRLIYELQVKSFTWRHPGIPQSKRGTVAALAEPVVIDHLLKLGVDAVELMPLTAWIDERHLVPLNLSNAWGYNPVTFMAPDPRLAPGGFAEIRAATNALRAAGIRTILDMVLNHTGESDEFGATLSLRGLDNALYFAHENGRLVNHAGCGNTVALDRAPVVQLAMAALRCWVDRGGIDGFRFDLAPVMGRTAAGYDVNAPLLSAIEQDPVLSSRLMIAEPWDVGPGGYRLGGFPPRWLEWNDHYRDTVRRYWNGSDGPGALATRLAGSSDVFAPHRRPSCSINFLAAHDGFTLADAVTFATKQNHANGEDNRDGNGHEPTWQGGDVRALLATLFLSRGTPMLTAGDEFGRSQKGNNNAYAQDNDVTWLNWQGVDAELVSFVGDLSALRRKHPALCRDHFLTSETDAMTALADAAWLGVDGQPVDWHDSSGAVLGLILAEAPSRIAVWFNRSSAPAQPVNPPREGWRWQRSYCSVHGDGLPARSVALFEEVRAKQQGASDHSIVDLAAAAGIERDWWEVDGTHHTVTPETLRAVLTALRLPHQSPSDVTQSLVHLRQRRRPIVTTAGVKTVISSAAKSRRRYLLSRETGDTSQHDAAAGEEFLLALPAGVWQLRNGDDDSDTRLMIVSPGSCYVPGDIAAGRRVFGLASHLYALRHAGDGGVGDFETLRRFASLTAYHGGRYAGLNPLHHMFPSDRSRASPYQPSDRRYIDPIYINVNRLLDRVNLPKARALAGRSRASFARLEALTHVDYAAVWAAKSAVLEQAYAELSTTPGFEQFRAAGGESLLRHGRFEAVLANDTPSEDRVRYRAFLQWVADGQLADAARQDNLYRDMALGSAFDGGEIADAPDLFAAGMSLGAPPDPFSREGQVWNLPPQSPLALEDRGFAPLRDVLDANMRYAAALRIDHILGFMRQFWVPRGAEGRFGAYVNFPIDAMVALTAIASQHYRTLVIGEDLGTIPDGLRNTLAAARILSYRVLWFERQGLGFHPAAQYPEWALACLASHDLPTFRGWREGRDIAIEQQLGRVTALEAEKRAMERQSEIAALDAMSGSVGGSLADATVAAHGCVAAAPSRVMLVQADDLSGETEPLNVPGTDGERPNWRRRLQCTVDDLMADPQAQNIISRVKAERS